MIKSAVIFQEKSKKRRKVDKQPIKDLMTLARNEYREHLHTAYQEGKKDALKEKKKEAFERDKSDDIKQKGKEEAIKKHAQEREENRQRFKTISARHDIELLRAESVFPFTLFTDTLIIDTTKISVSKKQLFATEYITTIPLKDLSDVNVQTVLFLGSIIIKYMPQAASPGMNNPVIVRIPNLKREAAIKAKNILKGALVAKAEEIDIATLSPDEIEQVLHKFGETEGII